MHNLIFFISFVVVFFSCNGKAEEQKGVAQAIHGYNFSSPSKIYKLTKELKEISGLQYLGNQLVACIQDEKGKIFIYNLSSSSIDQIISFGHDGDYEDLTKVNEDYYVLRSDGKLFKKSASSTEELSTGLTKDDNFEGLCYDREGERLILGSKKEGAFYSFTLSDASVDKKPIFSIQQKKFSPTAIGIHPITQQLYIVSKEKIIIADKKGTIVQTISLNPSLFPQPEGITFKEDGTLLISNEAAGSTATILEFNYQTL